MNQDNNSSRLKEFLWYSPMFLLAAAFTFFVLSSRPTADEYLLATVYDGFLVDQPDQPLFSPSSNPFLRYLQGAEAMVSLGWDAWPNVLTFQMGPGVLTNYLGPGASIIQGFITWFLLYVLVKFFLDAVVIDIQRKSQVVAGILLTVLGAFAVGNFNTYRENFGLYPFLGIRFSLYLLHALFFVALVMEFEKTKEKKHHLPTPRLLLFVCLFVGFVSLWYVMYLLLFLLIHLLIKVVKKQSAKFEFVNLTLASGLTMLFHAGLSGVRSRTDGEEVTTFRKALNFGGDVLLNLDSRLYKYELWSTVIGLHSLVALLGGCSIALFLNNRVSWNKTRINSLLKMSIVSLGVLPVTFVFQESLTYEAWWHRTTPIALSSFVFILLGIWISWLLPEMTQDLIKLRMATTGLLLLSVIAASGIWNSLNSINSFRATWDKGNVLGLGSPVENNFDFNVINALRVNPYTNKNWDAQKRVFAELPIGLMYVNESDQEIESNQINSFVNLKLTIGSSPFTRELDGKILYRISFSSSEPTDSILRVSDASGTTTKKLPALSATTIYGEVELENSALFSIVDATGSASIENIAVGFSGKLRDKFGLLDEQMVEVVK